MTNIMIKDMETWIVEKMSIEKQMFKLGEARPDLSGALFLF
jgi:hypothetical protein